MNLDFKINGKVLETERLILRPFKLEDLDDFYEYASVPDVGERAGWNHHENKDESLIVLSRFIESDKTFAILLKENKKVIGSLGVEKYNDEDKLQEFKDYKGRELGFVLSKDYWGKGIMKEAVDRVCEYLFDEMDLDFLLCGHFENNTQSRRVQEKCGFKPYRKLIINTSMDTKEQGFLNLKINPKKNIKFKFSHPETLIWEGN